VIVSNHPAKHRDFYQFMIKSKPFFTLDATDYPLQLVDNPDPMRTASGMTSRAN
jgi:hypothetical protein